MLPKSEEWDYSSVPGSVLPHVQQADLDAPAIYFTDAVDGADHNAPEQADIIPAADYQSMGCGDDVVENACEGSGKGWWGGTYTNLIVINMVTEPKKEEATEQVLSGIHKADQDGVYGMKTQSIIQTEDRAVEAAEEIVL